MFFLGKRVEIYEHRFVQFTPPVTMREVAKAMGVAVSTVSKALRNDPSIPAKRCLSIQAAARRLGYHPHPMVATLMAQLHHHRRRSDPHNIAWIDLWPENKKSVGVMNIDHLLRGARQRSQELGYDIEVYHAGAAGMSPERLRRTLTARSQWGLIIPPVPEFAMRFALDFRGLTGVTIGTSLHEPVMHRVSPNHFQSGILAFDRLRAKGFSRIGLILTPAMNERVEFKWLGAFLACQQRLSTHERVSPLIAPHEDQKSITHWLENENPHVVLLAEDCPTLTAKKSSSKSPSVAWLLQQSDHRDLGYLDYLPDQLGRVAVEMVVAQIHRNERGDPEIPHSVLIDSVWVDSAVHVPA